MDTIDTEILERAKELQLLFTEEGFEPPIEDCIEMAIEERKNEKNWYFV
jgi:hypothetical protein